MRLQPCTLTRIILAPMLLSAPVTAQAQRVEEVLDIGEVDGPAEQMFTRIQSVVVASDGSIIVLETGDLSIRVFAPDGRFLRSIGRARVWSGSGPWNGSALRSGFLGESAVSS